jgi:predicted nucleotidyltransferase
LTEGDCYTALSGRRLEMNSTALKCREILETAYGDRFVMLIVYGSTARNETDKESDLDMLVILRGTFDYFKELRTITELLYPIQLDSDRLISAKPAAVEDYRSGSLQLYRNALREGVSL